MENTEIKKAIERVESYLTAFQEYPDWSVLDMDTVDAMETLVEFVKTKYINNDCT